MSYRRFAFTMFRRNKAASEQWSSPLVQYAVWQVEKAPSTGVLHIQGFIELTKKIRPTQFKREVLESDEAHVESCGGNAEQNKAYCTKQDTRVESPWEQGTMVTQGQRSDLEEMTQYAVSGASLMQIMEKYPKQYLLHCRGIRELVAGLRMKESMQDRDVKVLVLWGGTGTGKTRMAMDGNRLDTYKLDMTQNGCVWFDGYEGQRILVIDEFYGQSRCEDMLRWLDRYPLRLPIKGSFAWAAWKVVIITSNVHPRMWYGNVPVKVRMALRRRIGEIWEVKGYGNAALTPWEEEKEQNEFGNVPMAFGQSN